MKSKVKKSLLKSADTVESSSYGSRFIENLARDIKLDFPDAEGYSVRNLRYMRKFAELFGDIENLQVPLADLTWYHHQALMDKTTDTDRYIWYAAKTIENGWSRNILVHQADTLPSAEDIERRIKSKYNIKDDAGDSGGAE